MARVRTTWRVVVVLLLGAGTASCGEPYLHAVDDGVYGALVPTAEQWADARSDAIPGGFAALRADGAERVAVRIEGDTVTFELDGEIAEIRTVMERRDILLGGEPSDGHPGDRHGHRVHARHR